jgi:hypothetical protein
LGIPQSSPRPPPEASGVVCTVVRVVSSSNSCTSHLRKESGGLGGIWFWAARRFNRVLHPIKCYVIGNSAIR